MIAPSTKDLWFLEPDGKIQRSSWLAERTQVVVKAVCTTDMWKTDDDSYCVSCC